MAAEFSAKSPPADKGICTQVLASAPGKVPSGACCSEEDDCKCGAVKGNVVVIERGGCAFFDKCNNAQNAEASQAAAVVIFDNNDGPLFAMGHTEPVQLEIPAVMISQTSGKAVVELLKASPGASVLIVAKVDKGHNSGKVATRATASVRCVQRLKLTAAPLLPPPAPLCRCPISHTSLSRRIPPSSSTRL
jgi:hypothetical protein